MDSDLYELVRRMLLQPGWSDLHIHVGQPPRLRNADMALVPVPAPIPTAPITEEAFAAFAGRLTRFGENWRDELERGAGNLDCSAQLHAADGRAQRFRANFLWHGAGARQPGLVMRRINESIPALESLGLPAAAIALGERASGLLLFTGVTGSGKSTSMAAMLARIAAAGGQNIVTLEDPVEYLFGTRWPAQILQREVGAGKDCATFAAGLRAALREDPDVIMVGEIRDAETAELALMAAQTGHLVLSTLHTRSAVHTVDRLVAMFASDARDDARAQLAGCLLGVVSQMLLPAIGGGRVLAAEMMVGTPAIAANVRDGKSNQIGNTMRNEQRSHGSTLLNQALATLVQAGRIERQVALAVAYDPAELREALGGGR